MRCTAYRTRLIKTGLSIFAVFLSFFTFGQNTANLTAPSLRTHRHDLYFYWGYNRTAFSRSDLHLSGPDYDFKLYDITAKDRPSPIGLNYLDPSQLTVPQFCLRIGYFINKNISLSLGYDHMKYVMDKNQYARMSGHIAPEASDLYEGTYTNELIKLTSGFLTFEHTNGLNFISADGEYHLPLSTHFKGKIKINLSSGIGAGFLLPKTDVTLFGSRTDNKFHIAGWGFDLKTGPEIAFGNHFFLLVQGKGGYIILPDILVHNESPERADQQFGFFQFFVSAGFYFL